MSLLLADDFADDFGAAAPADVPAPSSLPAWARDLFFPRPLLPDDMFKFPLSNFLIVFKYLLKHLKYSCSNLAYLNNRSNQLKDHVNSKQLDEKQNDMHYL